MINLNNKGTSVNGVNLSTLSTKNGNITVAADGTMIVGSVIAGGAASAVDLTTTNGGSILDDGLDTTWIAGNSITLNSDGDIGSFPSQTPEIDPYFLGIDHGVGNLTVNAPNGNIYLNIVNGDFSLVNFL